MSSYAKLSATESVPLAASGTEPVPGDIQAISVSSAQPKRWWWRLVKYSLLAVILTAVAFQGWRMYRQIDFRDVMLRPAWLVPAALMYVLGWLPAVAYWRELLRSRGYKVSWPELLRAYFCGHIGKYVPGKAGVLLIRAALLRGSGTPVGLAAVTAGYETLATMGAGAAVGVALLPWIVSAATVEKWLGGVQAATWARIGIPVLVLAACLAGLPLVSRIFNLIVKKLLPPDPAAGSAPLQASLGGFVLLIGGWWLHGLSLGLTIEAFTPGTLQWSHWPGWTAGAALATVLGFVALFAPGGAGIREAVLMETLAPQLGSRAVLAAGLLRIVWLAGELLAAGLFSIAVRPARKDS